MKHRHRLEETKWAAPDKVQAINNIHLSFEASEKNEKSLSWAEWDASKSSKPWDRTVYTPEGYLFKHHT